MLFFARSIALLTVLALPGAAPAAAQESGGFFSRFIPSFGSTPAGEAGSTARPNAFAMPDPVSKPGTVDAKPDPAGAASARAAAKPNAFSMPDSVTKAGSVDAKPDPAAAAAARAVAKPNAFAMSEPVTKAGTKAGSFDQQSDPTDASPFAGGSGGLVAAINGRHSSSCDGLVCMLMGGETKGTPAAAPAPQTTAYATAPSTPPVDDRVSPRKDRCTAPANDPWRCYR